MAARRPRRPRAGERPGAYGVPQVRFHQKLVLNQVLLGLFGVDEFDQLARHLREESLEGLDENNIHRLHHALCLHLPADRRPELPDTSLLDHHQAIVSVTQRRNDRRLSRGRGVGFFEAGNFHPDFIVWQIEGKKQYVNFVDPKGILHLAPTDPNLDPAIAAIDWTAS